MASAIADQVAPSRHRKDAASVCVLRGLEVLADGASEDYAFVAMKRAAIRFVSEERRERNVEEVAWQPANEDPEQRAVVFEAINAFYAATDGLDQRKLAFLSSLVAAVIRDEDGPLSVACRESGFTTAYGCKVLYTVRQRIEGGYGKTDRRKLREVRSLRDLQKLLHRRSRQR